MSTTETATAGTTDLAQETAKAGMPQLDFSTFPNQIFWLLVTLVVIYVVLANVALPRIGSTLANRKSAVAGDLAAAEELKQKARAAEKTYDAALIAARAEAAKIVALAKADITADLNAAIVRADADIAARSAESAKVIAEINAGAAEAMAAVANDTALALVAAFGGTPDAAVVQAAVSARLRG